MDLTKLKPGLYDKDEKLIMTWDELLKGSFIIVDNNEIININEIEQYLVIPNDIKSIDVSAFDLSPEIKGIYIPDNIEKIRDEIFDNCGSLQIIQVSSKNPTYDSRENCNALINSKSNKLISGSNNTKIPKDIIEISEYAFTYKEKFQEITIPKGVEKIGKYAFLQCNKLEKVTLNKNLKFIGNGIFCGCYRLKQIIYPGTEKEFKQIYGWKNMFETNNLKIENVIFAKTLEELINEGKSIREANRILKTQEEIK